VHGDCLTLTLRIYRISMLYRISINCCQDLLKQDKVCGGKRGQIPRPMFVHCSLIHNKIDCNKYFLKKILDLFVFIRRVIVS
jgi:hypothetical protein